MKTNFEILEDLRKTEEMIQIIRWHVLNNEFKASNSERKDLMKKIHSIVTLAEQTKYNLFNGMV